MMDPRSPERWNLTEKLELPSREGLSGARRPPSVSDRHPESLIRGEAGLILRPGPDGKGGRAGRRVAPGTGRPVWAQAWVAEVRSSDTPGPMVELIEIFCR